MLFKTSGNESEIKFSDAMFAECTTQSLPELFVRRESERTGRLDIESMYYARAESTLADSDNLRVSRDNGIQHGVVLIRPQRMDPATRRFVYDEPATTFRQHFQGQVRTRNRTLVAGENRSVDFEDLAKRGRVGFVGQAERPLAAPNPADFEQMTHACSRDRKLIGEEPIQTLALAALAYFDTH